MSVVYGVTTALSLCLVGGYCVLMKKKDPWLLFLHAAVVIVNLGYFALSISGTLEEALLANRISYFGSVFLPLCMLMAIMDVCRSKYKKRLPGMLICCSIAVFVLAASPGYLDCYYKEVALVYVNGVAKLDKTYGPLHAVYPVYLAVYFGMMIGVIITSIRKKKVESHKQAAILLTVVFLNITIWALEQIIYTEFEFLSVSYIISELLLLLLYGMMQDYGIAPESAAMPKKNFEGTPTEPIAVDAGGDCSESAETPSDCEEQKEAASEQNDELINQLAEEWSLECELTRRETEVLLALLKNKKRKEIAEELFVTEHTVKKHTGNVFSKLGVSSREELFQKVHRS